MKTIKELSDRQIKLAWISSKSLYEICKKLEIHDNTLDITIENASKPELWYRYPSNPNTFKECFKLFNLCFYRNVVKDSVDKIINWFKK